MTIQDHKVYAQTSIVNTSSERALLGGPQEESTTLHKMWPRKCIMGVIILRG